MKILVSLIISTLLLISPQSAFALSACKTATIWAMTYCGNFNDDILNTAGPCQDAVEDLFKVCPVYFSSGEYA